MLALFGSAVAHGELPTLRRGSVGGGAVFAASRLLGSTGPSRIGMRGLPASPGAAVSFRVRSAVHPIAGEATFLHVIALDRHGRVARGFTGRVRFAATDKAASLPKSGLVVHGVGSFSVTWRTANVEHVSATAVGIRALTGVQRGITVEPGVARHMSLSGIGSAVSVGDPVRIKVIVTDKFGNLASRYRGTVHFSSSDAAATLPSDGPLAAGQGTFAMSFASPGVQSVTARDIALASVTATEGPITVVPAPAPAPAPPCTTAPLAGDIGTQITPNANDGSLSPGTPGSALFRDDHVKLSAAPSSACLDAAPFSYSWTLTGPSGSSGLSSTTASTPSFTADRSAGTWTASLVVTDAFGRKSQPVTTTLSSDQCGAFPVSVSTITDQTAGKAFDTHHLSTTASSVDDNPARCPSRFANASYAYQWSVSGPGTKHTLVGAGHQATLAVGEAGSWTASVVATGQNSGLTGSGALMISTPSCSTAPALSGSPTASGATSPHSGANSGDFNQGDSISLNSPGVDVSSCYTNAADAQLSYSWGLVPAAGDPGPAPALASSTAASPSFVGDRPSEALSVAVAVTDKWGYSSSAAPLALAASSCGASPVSVSTITDQTAGKAFDPHTLSTTATSADDNPASCPSRFANTSYTYQWSVNRPSPSSRSILGASGSHVVTFQAGDEGTWGVSVVATGSTSGLTGSDSVDLAVACASPNPAVASPNHDPPSFNQGDTVTLSTLVDVSACYTDPSDAGPFAYSWSLSSDDSNPAPTLSSATGTTPTFTEGFAGQQLTAQIAVTDKWGRLGSSSATFSANP